MKKKLSTKILSLFLAMLMVITILPAGAITASAANSKLESAINEAIKIANNDYYGYHYGARHGNHKCSNSWCNNEDFDCSSFVATALQKGGINVSMFSTNDMTTFTKNGFIYIAGTSNLQRGDILWRNGHVGIYLGNNQVVHAMYNYNNAKGGKGGGQYRYGTWRSGADEIRIDSLNWFGSITGAYRYTKDGPPPPPSIPNTPNTPNLSATNVAKGDSVTISWNAVSGATSYTVGIRGAIEKDINVGNTTSYTYKLDTAATYQFYVRASNSSGNSSWSTNKSCTAHNPVTVKFIDWDDTLLGIQEVKYGSSAKAPVSPERKGYSFQGWSDSFYNVTSNKTIKATYKVITYTVNFYDKSGDLLKSEKVDYGNDATPPTDTNNPTGFDFLGWDSENYKNVFTEASNKTININGIYSWFNDDLPVICNITSASRQPDGYYVYFDLTNYDKAITRGRAVVSLKTSSGKLVDMTESAAFSLPKDSTKKGMEVFIPCDYAATSVEVIIVDSYSSGVPISEKTSSSIDQGLMWSQWSTEQPDASSGGLDVESRTEYRYRDKENSTGNTKTKDGWIWDGTSSSSTGNWSSWSWNSVSAYSNESSKREVQTQSAIKSYNYKTVYNYYRWAKQYSGGTSSPSYSSTYPNYYEYSFDSELGLYATGKYKWWYSSSNYCVVYPRSPYTSQVQTSANYATQYRYRDTTYTYNFYRWKDWTDWSANEVTATSSREVETRTTYRYKNNSAGIENDDGIERTIKGNLSSSFAGKQITLYVYGYTGASDYTNEYIGQSVIAEDGSYSFTFKLREEPSIKTGDFTVAIGIEGTTNTTVIDIIEAPKPTYTVKFYDWDGTIISTQTIAEGDDAQLPKNPEKEGYNFVGWDKSVANIREDTDFFADFEKQTFTVVFVDWQNQLIEVKTFEYGDVLTTPDFSEVEGYTFEGWDEILNGNIIVTQNMIVTAKYEINTYTVKFYDFDNNVISIQEIEYGSNAEAPDLDSSSDGKQFAGWFNPNDYEYVDHDVSIYPSYYFEETTDTPTANYESGEYGDIIQLELTSSDKNAVIYYYLNDDESTEAIYTEPITINKTCSISFFATSFGKNDSEIETRYYCINSSDKPSDWMLYSELPAEVTDNLDDYSIESKTGYRYKDTQTTSDKNTASDLDNSGWTFDKNTYTDYTPWQDEVITVDNNLIGFEIDTQEVEDPTVTRYQYSHYKYTDSEGNIQYAPNSVDGNDCTYETIVLDSRLTIAGFLDDGNNTSYYEYDGQKWFTQTKVNGIKNQYRSRYQIAEYYKWTTWGIDSPPSGEIREYERDTVYRYSNKNYHIVTVITGFDGGTPHIYFVQDNTTYDGLNLETEGYTLDLYYDYGFESEFKLTTPVTKSITLYAKYTPKTYTVIFQMQDGTEIDTQRVNYMDSATEPKTDVVPGYVFGGWDKDFDCITGDTTITGKYFKESEYARISLDKTNADMYQGNTITLIPTITPSNLTNEVVEWTSSDPGVASVDDTGRVTAVSAGTATITAMVVKTKETATCTITVSPDKSNFIILKSNSTLNYDDLGFLRRISLKTSVETVKDEFVNESLSFCNISGEELSDNDYVGTGTQIKLFNGTNVVDTKTVVITGDMTGDGIINNRDVAMMNGYVLNKNTAETCQMLAIDVNGDGSINNRDAAMVARYLVGKDAF